MRSKSRTVLIDCNDSFTYNIRELLRRAGAPDLEIIKVADLVPGGIAGAGRIILSPGPGVAEDYPGIFQLLRLLCSQERPIPVLGICLGHQIISAFFGGHLYNLDGVIHGQPHEINVVAGDLLFNGLPQSFTAGLYHSWAVEKPLPPALEVIAESDSGTIMGVRHRELPFRGIQFHPESFISEYGKELLVNFLNQRSL